MVICITIRGYIVKAIWLFKFEYQQSRYFKRQSCYYNAGLVQPENCKFSSDREEPNQALVVRHTLGRQN